MACQCTLSLILCLIGGTMPLIFAAWFAFGDDVWLFGSALRRCFGLIVRLHANGLSFRLQGLLACFGDGVSLRFLRLQVSAIGCLHYKLRNRNLR